MPGSQFQNKAGTQAERSSPVDWMEETIQQVAVTLPIVRPLLHYEHDHPLRPWMQLDFEDALAHVESSYATDALLSPYEFAQLCAAGRIRKGDLSKFTQAYVDRQLPVGAPAEDPLVALQLGTRHSLFLAMLQAPETDCDFDPENRVESLVDAHLATSSPHESIQLKDFRIWLTSLQTDMPSKDRDLVSYLERDTIGRKLDKWNLRHWQIAFQHALWWCCKQGARDWQPPFEKAGRIRQSITQLAPNVDDEIRRLCVPFLSAYIDPGVASWQLPSRDQGLFKCFTESLGQLGTIGQYSHLNRQLASLLNAHATMMPRVSIESSLRALELGDAEGRTYILDLVNALRGWAGLMYHASTSEYPCHPSVRKFSLTEFIACLLLVDRSVLAHQLGTSAASEHVRVTEISKALQREQRQQALRKRLDARRIWLFQIAERLNWSPKALYSLRPSDWSAIQHELNCFSKADRQLVALEALEHSYARSVITALQNPMSRKHGHSQVAQQRMKSVEAGLLITCAEPCEESLRRHVEAICPWMETIGVPGFFNLDIKFKESRSAHFLPHAPANVRKRHLVSEVEMEPPFRQYTLELEQPIAQPVSTTSQKSIESFPVHGFTIAEMAAVIGRLLLEAGVAQRLPRLIVVMGHETSSVNNLYEAADNCTFCSKQNVRINTRAFVQMANDFRVRRSMRDEGVNIPEATQFVAAVHDTCSDVVSFLETERVPASHRDQLSELVNVIRAAAERNALERCHRMAPGVPWNIEQAVEHCVDRQSSGAHARPEISLMGNALCIVGRRSLTRSLHLDRRSFLFSYDPSQDDEDLTLLARLLSVNLPVLVNISFDYWFSRVAPDRFGAGRKSELRNIGCMVVTDTEYGDVKIGLPYEMVDQHEPMRLLVIVEAQPEKVQRMLAANPRVSRFTERRYIQFGTYHSGQFMRWQEGRWEAEILNPH